MRGRLDHIAEMVDALSASDPAMVYEVTLLAARARLASGDAARAREYAARLVEDVNAPDGLRLAALDVLDAAKSQISSSQEEVLVGEIVLAPQPAPAEEGARPPQRSPEVIESMPLPDDLAVGQTRATMTRMAQELAREYRAAYGTTLKTDVAAIEAMQRHLRRRAGSELDERTSRELQRHGALLSEIIARRLGGAWIDVGPSEMGFWTMRVPPANDVRPIGRVFCFFTLGTRDRDLVSYFSELEARARKT